MLIFWFLLWNLDQPKLFVNYIGYVYSLQSVVLVTGYGLTEAPVIFSNSEDCVKEGSVGTALPGVQYKVCMYSAIWCTVQGLCVLCHLVYNTMFSMCLQVNPIPLANQTCKRKRTLPLTTLPNASGKSTQYLWQVDSLNPVP